MELEAMENELPNEDEQEISSSDSDWDNRILCSDGNCIGVVGPDGNCKECGKKYEGKFPEVIASEIESEPDDFSPGNDIEDPPPSDTDAAPDEDSEPDDWSSRKLCSDGNCIGVIGSDGRCKECGKPLE